MAASRYREDERVEGTLVDEVQQLADRLADRLQQSVAVDDPTGNLIVVSRHFGDADPYRVRLMLDRRIPRECRDYFMSYTKDATAAPVRIPASPQLSLAARICFPIRNDNVNVAYLWLLDLDKALPQELIEQYCARLAQVLSERRGRQDPAVPTMSVEQPLRRLLAGDLPADVLSDPGIDMAALQRRHIVVAHYTGDGPDRDMARRFRRVAGSAADLGVTLACTADLHGCSVGVFHTDAAEPGAESHVSGWLLDGTRRILTDRPGGAGCGISAAGECSEVRRLFARASLAAFICLHLYRAENTLSWDQVRPLAALIAGDVAEAGSGPTAALTTLLLDPDNSAFDTVGAVLRSDRDHSPADILHVHRTTLHYRLQQILELTGLDLAVPSDRFLAIGSWLRVALSNSPLAELARSV